MFHLCRVTVVRFTEAYAVNALQFRYFDGGRARETNFFGALTLQGSFCGGPPVFVDSGSAAVEQVEKLSGFRTSLLDDIRAVVLPFVTDLPNVKI